ncbi:hypothetical protein QFZ55_005547 [Streptomyces luteogriseus]|nr:hypothetical protein [Streptomyces luteogriseus]
MVPGFTLRTYTHLMPGSEKRTREAVDRAFEDGPSGEDGPATAQDAQFPGGECRSDRDQPQ